MKGPPVEIYLTENPIPQRVSTPATVSLHWQEQVKADLDKDEAMGVIKKVEEPSEWCQQMVVVRKPDGSSRRTVDFQPLNKFCRHEEFAAD